MVTSFADGSKISFEQAIVANATGFKVKSRGMSRGLEYRGNIMNIGELYDVDEVRALGGIVDYVVGTPLTKVYVLADIRPQAASLFEPLQDGRGSTVFVLHALSPRAFRGSKCHCSRCSVPRFVAPPLAGPVVEVCAVAKRDLRSGRDPGQLRHVHDVRRSGERRRNEVPPQSRTLLRRPSSADRGGRAITIVMSKPPAARAQSRRQHHLPAVAGGHRRLAQSPRWARVPRTWTCRRPRARPADPDRCRQAGSAAGARRAQVVRCLGMTRVAHGGRPVMRSTQ